MDVDTASRFLNTGSGWLSSFTNWLSKVIAWTFTFRNIIFILIIVGIVVITYKLFENEVNKKKYYFKRNREV